MRTLVGDPSLFVPKWAATVILGLVTAWMSCSPCRGEQWVFSGTWRREVLAVGVDPAAPNVVFAGTWGGGVSGTTDGGATWSPLNSGLSNLEIQSLAISPGASGAMFVGTYRNGVFRSVDRGQHWSEANNGIGFLDVCAVAIAPSNPNTVYAIGKWTAVYRSVDGGAHWAAANTSGLRIEDLVVDPRDANVLYGNGSAGLFKSADGGASWSKLAGGGNAFALDPSSPDRLVLAGGTAVYRSEDGGSNWSQIGSLPYTGFDSDLSVAVNPANPAVVLFGGRYTGVLLSTDYGATWSEASNGLLSGTIYSLVFDPFVPGRVFAGTWGGLYVGQFDVADLCTYQVSSGSTQFPPEGGSGAVGILASGAACPWAAVSDSSWLSITSGASGVGDSTVSFTVTANPTPIGRTGTLTIAGVTVTVSQSGLTCAYQVTPQAIEAPADGGTWSVTVVTEAQCQWSASSSSAWIHAAPASGSGGGTTVVSVDENTSQARSGVLSIGGSSVSVSQSASSDPCPYLLWVPVASHAPGANNSQWRTDLGLLNRGTGDATIELEAHFTSTWPSRKSVLAAWNQTIISDVVNWISYGLTGTGALRICSNQPIDVTSRTYNLVAPYAACYPGGTFGQFYAALETREALGFREVAWLPGLVESNLFRCNIGIVNTGTSPASARVELRDGKGAELASYDVLLDPGQLKQENRPFFTKAGRTDLAQAYARVEVTAGAGIVAYGSVVDNKTNDPITIPMKR